MIYLYNTNRTYKQYSTCYHLVADSVEELQEFVNKIGLKKEWFQSKSIIPHYDIFGSMIQKVKRYKEIKIIKNREMINLIRKYRPEIFKKYDKKINKI